MTSPRLPNPYTEGPDASEEEQDAWATGIDSFIQHLVANKINHQTTATQVFLDSGFNEPQHQDLLYYYSCAGLLTATRENSQAGPYILIIAEFFKLLKEEGLKRDKTPSAHRSWGNAVVFPTLRGIADDIPVPPGFKYDPLAFSVGPDAEYVRNDDTYLSDIASYTQEQEGMIRFWSLVGHLEALHVFVDGSSAGAMTLLYHSGPSLIRALETPALRATWETVWAAVPMLQPGNGQFPNGTWNGDADERSVQWRAAFLDAANTIALDERAPMEWRGRFAIIARSLSTNR
ncbi:hypothetical protein MIND_00205500 [Mycena indigotica]|uniref:Uncharacterized protein n=1 Tax=Mycena indigotica TaxID=2126181 RepID=A0A8H6WCZ2_9AGAR|nr:uncharacterized protein MIND_00205500 [Mycena indigotica]KAF7311941.1 hypothetical protein MIND_00205500 [Mycena indigotica]